MSLYLERTIHDTATSGFMRQLDISSFVIPVVFQHFVTAKASISLPPNKGLPGRSSHTTALSSTAGGRRTRTCPSAPFSHSHTNSQCYEKRRPGRCTCIEMLAWMAVEVVEAVLGAGYTAYDLHAAVDNRMQCQLYWWARLHYREQRLGERFAPIDDL
ncbi:hypothetical protein BKA67DRAFT_146024 [Truncatella angustata]|uniref:Uncharacterized protein n=1 Tax=Truncatella angustata TaxID=152316 RepID=A0A9P8REH6_9PEZI|nr:uncharacterized protein BKA67DRAFT_146024 [Truncatella angustata]KAH6638654.1 hypothetical protein BKA67DRAFT_146024 [Truncatella angustata]